MTIKVLPPELARLRFLLTPLLGRIADLLPGYRLTLVGRHAEREDGEIILSSDDLPQASAVLARHALLERSKGDVAGESLEGTIGVPVARTCLIALGREVVISTIHLGVDHGFGEPGGPVLFETEVLGIPGWQPRWRYRTWTEAAIGHSKATLVTVGYLIDWAGQASA